MAFFKEEISKEDFEKYQIGRYRERIPSGFRPGDDWAIDRERNIYLMIISSSEREPEYFGLNTILFFFDGEVYIAKVFLDLNKIGEKHWSLHWREHSWSFVPYFSSKKIGASKLFVAETVGEVRTLTANARNDSLHT